MPYAICNPVEYNTIGDPILLWRRHLVVILHTLIPIEQDKDMVYHMSTTGLMPVCAFKTNLPIMHFPFGNTNQINEEG